MAESFVVGEKVVSPATNLGAQECWEIEAVGRIASDSVFCGGLSKLVASVTDCLKCDTYKPRLGARIRCSQKVIVVG